MILPNCLVVRLPKLGAMYISTLTFHTKCEQKRRNDIMRIKILAMMLTAIVLLVGCQGANKGTNPSDKAPNNMTTDNTDNNMETRNLSTNNGNNMDNNTTDLNANQNGDRPSNRSQDEYDVSEEAADRIVEEIPEINQAYVLTTNRNAYVAATLDERGETRQTETLNERNDNSTSMNTTNSNDRNVVSRTENNGNANDRGQDNHMTNFRGDNIGPDGEELSDEVKNKISDIVKDIDDQIDNVYVSTSPDFFDLADNYIGDMENGKPISGFFDQIGNMIERIFPQNR